MKLQMMLFMLCTVSIINSMDKQEGREKIGMAAELNGIFDQVENGKNGVIGFNRSMSTEEGRVELVYRRGMEILREDNFIFHYLPDDKVVITNSILYGLIGKDGGLDANLFSCSYISPWRNIMCLKGERHLLH